MAIPAGCTKFNLTGTAVGGEQFNTGFWIDQGFSTEGDLSLACAAVRAYFEGHCTNIKLLIRSDTAYTAVKGYSYPSGGPNASVVSFNTITAGVGTGTSTQPLQSAVVATLTTGLAGRSRRGRMYLPASGALLVTADHQISPTVAGNIASDVATFFNAINTDAGAITGSVSVMSSRLSSLVHVTGVKVDTRIDIQRRRANRESVTGSGSATVTP